MLMIMAVGAKGDQHIDGRMKRSDGLLVYDLVHQMAAEQVERAKLLEEFKGLKNECADIKRDLKERNTLLRDAKFLQKKIQRELKDTKSDLQDEVLDRVEKALKGFNSSLTSLQSDTKAIVTTMKQDKADTDQKIDRVKTKGFRKIEEIGKQMSLLRKETAHKNSHVAFSARLPASLTSATSSGLKFSTIISNIGGGYNGSDGVFYCHKDGLYSFTVTITGYAGNYVLAYIMRNTSQIATVYEYGYSNYRQSTSVTLALSLKFGDKVWVKGTGYKYHQYSYFTGILVKQ